MASDHAGSAAGHLECPVCLDDNNPATYVLLLTAYLQDRLPCGHHFCKNCAQKLVGKQCPLCRKDVFDSREDAIMVTLAKTLMAAKIQPPASPASNKSDYVKLQQAVQERYDSNSLAIRDVSARRSGQVVRYQYKTSVRDELNVSVSAVKNLVSAELLLSCLTDDGRELQTSSELQLFGDKLDLRVRSFDDIGRLNVEFLRLAQKLDFLDHEKATKPMRVIADNMKTLEVFLVEAKMRLNDQESVLPLLEEKTHAINNLLMELENLRADASAHYGYTRWQPNAKFLDSFDILRATLTLVPRAMSPAAANLNHHFSTGNWLWNVVLTPSAFTQPCPHGHSFPKKCFLGIGVHVSPAQATGTSDDPCFFGFFIQPVTTSSTQPAQPASGAAKAPNFGFTARPTQPTGWGFGSQQQQRPSGAGSSGTQTTASFGKPWDSTPLAQTATFGFGKAAKHDLTMSSFGAGLSVASPIPFSVGQINSWSLNLGINLSVPFAPTLTLWHSDGQRYSINLPTKYSFSPYVVACCTTVRGSVPEKVK